MSNKIKLIIEREYMTKVRRKSFVVMTLLGPLLFVGVFAIIAFLASVNKDSKTIAIYDETSLFVNTFKSTSELDYIYLPTHGISSAIDTSEANNYYGILYVPMKQNLDETVSSIEFISKDTPSILLTDKISKKIENTVREIKLLDLGISKQLVDKANVNVSINLVDNRGTTISTSSRLIQVGVGALSGLLIYMFIFIYGVQVMRSVIEEKTNRIIEVIISSVKPYQMMMGKIIGSALVGLTQFLLWSILSFTLFSVVSSMFGIERPGHNIPSVSGSVMNYNMEDLLVSILDMNYVFILGMFIFFFLAGYLLYSALFAAIGSAVDSETDTQQFMFPITLPLIIAMYSGFMVLENPDGPVAFWMSMIPFTSPIVMMVRIPFGVPTWEIILSMGLLVLGFVLTTLLAAKIYRTGILMYGKKVTYKEIWKWLRHS